MPGRERVNVVWFKCTDLRCHDHAALKAAHQGSLPVLHLYVFDPFWHAGQTRLCGFPKTGPIRNRFQLEAVEDLSHRLASKGQVLNIRSQISTKTCFEELCQDFTINSVFAFHEICSEELRVEQEVREVLRKHQQGTLNLFWGFELYHFNDLTFDPKRPKGAFNSYTAFRKRVEEGSQVRASNLETPSFRAPSMPWARADPQVPNLKVLMGSTYRADLDPGDEKDPRAELRWRGGETAALQRVQEYLWDEDSLGLDYVGATMTMDPSKSCMRDKAMSKFSPWLAHGCLSPRKLYEEVKRYERERRKNKSTYWITHELLWRDFVRFGSIYAGTSIFLIGGPQNVRPQWSWSTDRDRLNKWIEGETGFPFIDCFMRELKVTGYCNHMGRETAGWFLIADLQLDWRMAAEWFESVLIDYEPTANWYNWTYRCLPAAGKMPADRLGSLEILKWGRQHDPDATYIKRWIPELSSLPGTVAREPWRLGLHGNAGDGELRAMPSSGQFSVSRGALEALISMGFDQKEAAMALYRTWEDPDAAAALLLSGDGSKDKTMDSEEEDLARAMALSLGETPSESRRVPEEPKEGFRYGVDYPKPMIQPVSLMNTEQAEDEARQQQSRRDSQIAASKRQKGSGGQSFQKHNWEQARRDWPAETPTAARVDRENRSDDGGKGKGSKGKGGKAWNRRQGPQTKEPENDRGRRWGNRAMGG